jgi:hypothetical protein
MSFLLIIIIYILIREGKPLYPFLSKLRGRRSVRFGIVKVYVEKECRKIKFMYNIQDVPKKRDKSPPPYRQPLIDIHTHPWPGGGSFL